jgi:hypothetical protein
VLNVTAHEDFWLRGLNPVGCWFTLSVDWWLKENVIAPLEIASAIAGYALAGLVLHGSAYLLFARRSS